MNIVAKINNACDIQGQLQAEANIVGNISVPVSVMPAFYDGEYNVVPKAKEETVLATASKLMTNNVVVAKIPYFEVSNNVGQTVYIGKEVNIDGN